MRNMSSVGVSVLNVLLIICDAIYVIDEPCLHGR